MLLALRSGGRRTLTVVLVMVGCGGQTGEDGGHGAPAQPDASAGDPSATGGASSSVGGTNLGGADPRGAGGTPGTGGTGEHCPEVDCDLDCPAGWWLDQDGCYVCACAAPELTMPLPPVEASPEHISLSGHVAETSHGLDLDLVWSYDEEAMEDEEVTVEVELTVPGPAEAYRLDEPTTYDVLADPPLFVEAALLQSGLVSERAQELDCYGGFLTLSWVDGRLLGGVELELSSGVLVAGAFDLPAP